MLTLKAPIELKSRRDFVHDNESLYDRITANYSFLGRDIGSEELLHIANTPPEIYVAEGDLTTVSGNTVINSRNEEKLEMINNVLNRIVLSADAHLTYQDRAYITDILNKMGIRDDRRFMSEVRRLITENNEENRLINMFFEGQNIREGDEINSELMELVNRVENLEEKEENLYLSDSIMNRLETGAIYQIVSNFNRSINENTINSGEYAVTGQSDTARRILADRIIENYNYETSDLIFRETETEEESSREVSTERTERLRESYLTKGESIYEKEILSERGPDINITEEIGSALFLDIIKNLVSNAYEKNNRSIDQWIDFRSVLYRSSDNLFRRIAYLSEESSSSALNIANEYLTENVGLTYAVSGDEYRENYENPEYQYRSTTYRESSEETVNRTENRYEESLRTGDRYSTEYNVEGAEITYAESGENAAEAIPAPTIESFERELIKLNEKNLNSMEKYREVMNLVNSIEKVKREGDGKALTRRDALRALEGDADVIRELKEEEETEDNSRERVFHEITRLFPDNTGEVFNILEQYFENPELTQENIRVVNNNLAEAAEEIRKFQERDEVPPATEERIREERQEELVFRDNLSVDMEEIRENIEEIRRNSRVSRDRRTEDNNISERAVETRNVINTTTTSFTNEEVSDIQELVNRGVQSQMKAISEQVINKLEKRLKNEKTRRGI